MRAAYDGWHGLMLLIPRKLPMPDAGGRTSSVKTWLRLYTDAKLDIYIFFYFCQTGSGFILYCYGRPHRSHPTIIAVAHARYRRRVDCASKSGDWTSQPVDSETVRN